MCLLTIRTVGSVSVAEDLEDNKAVKAVLGVLHIDDS